MKTLTIKQPYASLISENIKQYEFRTWKTKYRGDILIHAGKGKDKNALNRFEDLNLDYQEGSIIAQATITDCIYVDNSFRKELKKLNKEVYKNVIEDTTWQGYAFKLENIKKLKPIQVKGKLSFWEYDYKEKEI